MLTGVRCRSFWSHFYDLLSNELEDRTLQYVALSIPLQRSVFFCFQGDLASEREICLAKQPVLLWQARENF